MMIDTEIPAMGRSQINKQVGKKANNAGVDISSWPSEKGTVIRLLDRFIEDDLELTVLLVDTAEASTVQIRSLKYDGYLVVSRNVVAFDLERAVMVKRAIERALELNHDRK
jgi:hypothetical protein